MGLNMFRSLTGAIYNNKNNIYIYGYTLLLLSVYLLYNCFADLNANDDKVFRSINYSWEFLVQRYNEWTSRIIIEYFMLWFERQHIIFIITNFTFILLLFYSICYLLNIIHKEMIALCILSCMLYNFPYMASSGIISCNVNYFMPMTLSIASLACYKKYISGGSCIYYILCIILAIISANMEQVCIYLLMLSGIYIIYLIWHRSRIPFSLLLLAALLFLELVFILTCPGNYARYESEITNWYPSWNRLQLIDKIINGTNYIGNYCFNKFNAICLFFSIALLTTLSNRSLRKLYYFIPVSSQLYLMIFHIKIGKYALLILTILNIIIYILTIINSRLDNSYKILITAILFTGFCTRYMLTFSPTIYASGQRTCLFMDYSLIISSLIFIKLHFQNNINKYLLCLYSLLIISFVQEANFIHFIVNKVIKII